MKRIFLLDSKSIAGQRRAEIIFKGEAGHAGTVQWICEKMHCQLLQNLFWKWRIYANKQKEKPCSNRWKTQHP